MAKLSKAQNELLKHLNENDTFLHFMPYRGRFNPNAYYFASATNKTFRFSTVDVLVKKGLLKIESKGKWGDDVKVYLPKKEGKNDNN